MSRYWLLFIGIVAASVQAGNAASPDPAPKQLCTKAWYQSIEKQLPTTSDAGKRGPDLGSNKWRAAIEKNLKLQGKTDVPERDSESWCRYVDERVHGPGTIAGAAPAQGASFDCEKVKKDSIEAMICDDKELSMLDHKLSVVYGEAKKKGKQSSQLEAEQRGWIKGRNDCWKSEEKSACIRDGYFRRIAEIEARYQLVSGIGPDYYRCGQKGDEVVVTFFETDPRTLLAKRGSATSLMYVVPSGSGTRYQGRNETFWEHQDEATIVWGAGATEMRCRKEQ